MQVQAGDGDLGRAPVASFAALVSQASEATNQGLRDSLQRAPSGRNGSLSYRRLFWCLLIAAWACGVAVAFAPGAPLRAAAGLPLVLLLPGALVTYAVLPPFSRIDGRLRAVLAVALSVAIALLIGLVLALVSDHISRIAAAVGLVAVATLAALVAFLRDNGEVELSLPARPRVSAAVVLVTGVLAVAAVAGTVAVLNVDTLPANFTAFSLTRDESGVRLTVSNREDGPMRFRYVLRDGRGVRLYSGSMRLGEGDERALILPVAPGTGLVLAHLFKGGSTTPYRSADLRL